MGFLEALADQTTIAFNSAQLFNEQQQPNFKVGESMSNSLGTW
jgi:hypothetical protein